MKNKTVPSIASLAVRFALLAATALVAACGGGGGGGGGTPGADEPELAPPSVIEAGCTDCNATGPEVFVPGGKAGFWTYTNTGPDAADVPVAITGLSGQSVTLTLTNGTNRDVGLAPRSLAPGPHAKSFRASNVPLDTSVKVEPELSEKEMEQARRVAERKEIIRNFNQAGLLSVSPASPDTGEVRGLRALARSMSLSPVASAVVGDTRDWVDCQDVNTANLTCRDVNPNRATTLVAQATAADFRKVNVWVQDTERGVNKVTDSVAQELAALYVQTYGVHDSLTTLGGAPWGVHNYATELIAPDQPVNLVLLNLTPDSRPYGLLGYFWAVNSFKKTSASLSNEAVAVFLDTETLYLDVSAESGLDQIKSTLIHEGTHMTNFYRRGVTMLGSPAFETWLEELVAMAAEDITSQRITPNFNSVRDSSLPYFLQTDSFNCSMTVFSSDFSQCFGYSVAGSFAGYLVRQLGVPFYQTLVSSLDVESVTALDSAIRFHRSDSSLGRELAEWARVAAARVSGSDLPDGFGYPALLNSVGFNVPGIDLGGSPFQYTPSVVTPTSLKAYASVAWRRANVSGTFKEIVQVPAGATLSVVIPNISNF